MEQKKISVVIPAFNEAAIIGETLAKVKTWLLENFSHSEIIVVDDGSTDNTRHILEKISGIKLLRNLGNHGKGYTVKKGVLAATGDLILFMDADNSTDISELSKLLPYCSQYPIVIGSRALADSVILKEQNKLKVMLGKSGNWLVRYLLSLDIKDTQCGFKLFRADCKILFSQMITNGWGFDFELMWLARQHKLAVKEVPIVWENNLDSKVGIKGYFLTLAELIKIRWYYTFKKIK